MSALAGLKRRVSKVLGRGKGKAPAEPSAPPAAAAAAPEAPAAQQATSDGSQKPLTEEEIATNRINPINKNTTPPLNITVYNHFSGRALYAYITATELSSGKLFLVQADGRTLYFPQSPAKTGQPLAQNCSIPVSGGGTTISVNTNFAGGRIWFCLDTPLTFLLNPGPGLVEPSPFNPSDPNAQKYWDFAEMTFDYGQLFANITYVDFTCLPIAMRLVSKNGGVQNVTGIPANGLQQVANQLNAQHNADGAPWNALIVNNNQGRLLRVLAPAGAISTNNSLFKGYWDNYVNQVWSKYTNAPLTINTQAQYGNVNGQVVSTFDGSGVNGTLKFPNGISFSKPNAIDIFGQNSGPFKAGQSAEAMTIVPRLAAAFARSTLLLNDGNVQPNGPSISQYYSGNVTDHYARILHAVNSDHLGYAFPYDDVNRDGQRGVAGTVSDGSPQTLFFTIGGGTNAAPA